jgi:tetratricopeptide (TPR) repeat protein
VIVVGSTSVAALVVLWRLSAYYAPDSQSGLDAAIALMKSGKWQEAELVLDKSLTVSDSPPRTLYWKAYVQFSTKRYSESASALRGYLERNPEDSQARKLLGLDLFMLGDAAGAQAELERAVELLPKDEEARYYLGRVYFSRQNLPAALSTYQKLLEFAPSSVRAHNQLGQTYEWLNQFELAEKAYEEAIRIDRESAKRSEWPYFNLGVLHLKAGTAERSLPFLQQALQIQPKFPQAQVQLGVALAALGKQQEAKAEFEAVVSAEPDNADAHYQLSRLYRKLGDPVKAKEHGLLFQRLRKP